MNLHHIRQEMGVSLEDLRKRGRNGVLADKFAAMRRQFVVRAFSAGCSDTDIALYLNRSPLMVEHALRMECLDRFGGPYGRNYAEMRHILAERELRK